MCELQEDFMFLKYRIQRLQIKTDIQRALVDKLEVAEKEYGSTYYTDLMIREHCKWVGLNSRLHFLKRKLDT